MKVEKHHTQVYVSKFVPEREVCGMSSRNTKSQREREEAEAQKRAVYLRRRADLLQLLVKDNRIDDISNALSDEAECLKLFEEFGI